MEYDIEKILQTYEDDYNPDPRPMDQEPRNMYSQGQLVRNTVDGSRPGYQGKQGVNVGDPNPGALKVKEMSTEKLYTKYGKEYVDNAAKEWAKISNLEKNRIRKIENTDLPLTEMVHKDDRGNFKVKFLNDIKKYKKWNPDRKSTQMTKRYANDVKRAKTGVFEQIIYDAFGRKDIKGTNKPNPNINLPKLDAIRKNLDEYKILKKYLYDNFKITVNLDHGLDKKTIQTIMNSSAADLTSVNILEQNLNNGFKKQLNNKYFEAVQMGGDKGLKKKRAVEAIAKKFNLDIGSIPDNQFVKNQLGPFQTNLIKKGAPSFETLNIKDAMLKSLNNADKLNTKWGKYVKENPGIFEDAGFNLKTLKKPKNVANITKNLPQIEKYLNSTVTEFGSKSKKGKAAIQALAILAGSTGAAVSDDGSEGTGGMLKDAAIAGGAIGTVGTKAGRKLLGNLFNVAGLPASIAFNYFAGIDGESSLDRSILGFELATAPGTLAAAKSVTDKIPNKILKKAAQVATGSTPFFLKAARIAQPVGIATLGGELVNKVIKESEPNYYIDPQTQEPTFYDRENAADVFPSMIDIYDQAFDISKKENISYKEALNKVNRERFDKLKND